MQFFTPFLSSFSLRDPSQKLWGRCCIHTLFFLPPFFAQILYPYKTQIVRESCSFIPKNQFLKMSFFGRPLKVRSFEKAAVLPSLAQSNLKTSKCVHFSTKKVQFRRKKRKKFPGKSEGFVNKSIGKSCFLPFLNQI